MLPENYKDRFGGALSDAQAVEVVEHWRSVVAFKAGREDIELAAPFQRHYLRFGTGLPPNWCLALTADEALGFKFDPRHGAHPSAVTPGQVKKLVATWPRAAIRVRETSKGPLAIGVVFEVAADGGADALVIPCRTPRLAVNPAAAAMVVTLGGELPAG